MGSTLILESRVTGHRLAEYPNGIRLLAATRQLAGQQNLLTGG